MLDNPINSIEVDLVPKIRERRRPPARRERGLQIGLCVTDTLRLTGWHT